jgi:hypothetical protein
MVSIGWIVLWDAARAIAPATTSCAGLLSGVDGGEDDEAELIDASGALTAVACRSPRGGEHGRVWGEGAGGRGRAPVPSPPCPKRGQDYHACAKLEQKVCNGPFATLFGTITGSRLGTPRPGTAIRSPPDHSARHLGHNGTMLPQKDTRTMMWGFHGHLAGPELIGVSALRKHLA